MRKSAAIVVAILIGLALHGIGHCDNAMTLTLDPSSSESRSSDESSVQLHHETLKTPHDQSSRSQHGRYASSTKEAVVGRVGLITSPRAEIKRYARRSARTLFSCRKDAYLAIVNQKGSWYGVLMIDSSTGWVEKSKIEILNYQVVAPSGGFTDGGSHIIGTALKFLGVPYRWGGCSSYGLDCSGFVRTVFASNGISLPRVARDQAQVGQPVSFDALRAGDRLYFACKGGSVDHAGIYMGNGLFIHSSVSRHGVAVDSINKSLFARSLVTARRS